MLREEFDIWPADPLSVVTLITINIYVTNLSYLEDKLLHFTKLLDDSMEESNKMLVGLDKTTIILKTDK